MPDRVPSSETSDACYPAWLGAVSSAWLERLLDTQEVRGSNPLRPTTPFIQSELPQIAGVYGLDVSDFLAEWKSIVCHGTKQEMWTATINGIDIHGPLIAGWTPPEGSICYEAVMLAVARAFLQGDTWIRTAYC